MELGLVAPGAGAATQVQPTAAAGVPPPDAWAANARKANVAHFADDSDEKGWAHDFEGNWSDFSGRPPAGARQRRNTGGAYTPQPRGEARGSGGGARGKPQAERLPASAFAIQ